MAQSFNRPLDHSRGSEPSSQSRDSYGAACLLVLLLVLAGCSKEQEKEAEPVRPVQLGDVTRGSIQRTVAADGVLRALDQSQVMPKISAPVARFLVNRGDHVRAGQLIAVLENRDLTAAVADAKGAYDQSEAALRNVSAASVPDEVAKSEADVQSARQTMEASQKVLESRQQLLQQGAIARRLVDEANVAYVQAKSQFDTAQRHLQSVQSVIRLEDVKAAEGQRDSAKGKYDAAQAQLAYSEVHSPIAGVIADRSLFPGEIAQPGTPLLTVMDISSVIARVNVPQSEAAYVRVGQPARIVAPDGTQADGKVTVISPAVDPQGTTVEVWVQAKNPGERLRPGGTVHATITADTVRNAVLAPLPALLPSSDGGTAVLTVGADMVAHEHTVKVGIRTTEQAQILDGVDAGAKVIVAGGLGLEDGAKVKLGETGEKEDKEDKGGKEEDKDDKK